MIYQFGAFQLDVDGLELSEDGALVKLQPQAFALLIFLIENRDRVVTKDEVIDKVWDARAVSDATLNTRINALRRALGDSGDVQSVIKTFPRRGFRFVASLNDSTPDSSVVAPRPNSDSKPSIAVLPFVNISGDAEQEFFADGITEDLVTSMSRIGGLFITGRNSTFAYKESRTDIKTISAELNVRYVLEGSVRTAGKRVRVSVRLTVGATGEQLWADRYDRELDDIFLIQDEVTNSVVGQLAPEIYSAENTRTQRIPPQNLDAWECFVRAMHQYSLQSAKSSSEAIRLLERATILDPEYAQAWGLYALTMAWRAIQRLEPFNEAVRLASRAAEAAIAADINEAWAHMGLGMAGMVARQQSKAVMGFERAVELSPNFAYAQAMCGAAHAYGGNPEKAIKCIDLAIRLSPRDAFLDKFYVYYSLAYFQGADYEKAALAAEQAIHLKPEHPNTHMLAAASHALAGNSEQAILALANFKDLVPGTNAANVERAIAYADLADRQRLANGLRLAGLEG